jgi:hypothetical protein
MIRYMTYLNRSCKTLGRTGTRAFCNLWPYVEETSGQFDYIPRASQGATIETLFHKLNQAVKAMLKISRPHRTIQANRTWLGLFDMVACSIANQWGNSENKIGRVGILKKLSLNFCKDTHAGAEFVVIKMAIGIYSSFIDEEYHSSDDRMQIASVLLCQRKGL